MSVNTFYIVTPTLNAVHYLDQAITSVLRQTGEFELVYHVQDGGSSDGTLDLLELWKSQIESGFFKPGCSRITFTYSSEQDRGLYDALARAFDGLHPPPEAWMTWLNSDDLLAPGALATISAVARDIPNVQWLGGRAALIGEEGALFLLGLLRSVPRRCIEAGLCDGRIMPFIQQEGSFWRAELWDKCGGIDDSFDLAGDWDLWRRMASVSPYSMVDAILGFHRRHERQKSNDLTKYWAEVDLILKKRRALYDRLVRELQFTDPSFEAQEKRGLRGAVVRYDLPRKRWGLNPYHAVAPAAPIVVTPQGESKAEPLIWHAGIERQFNPSVDQTMSPGFCWLRGSAAVGTIRCMSGGKHRFQLRLRTYLETADLALEVGGKLCLSARFPPMGSIRDYEIVIEVDLTPGETEVVLRSDSWNAEGKDIASKFRVALLAAFAVPLEPQHAQPTVSDSNNG